MGFLGFSWVFLAFTGFQRVLMAFTGFYWVSIPLNTCSRVMPTDFEDFFLTKKTPEVTIESTLFTSTTIQGKTQ